MGKSFAAGLLLLTMACSAKEVPYVDTVNAWHSTKDEFMRRSDDSPIPPERRAQLGLFDNLVRLSVGVEDLADLQADLAHALG